MNRLILASTALLLGLAPGLAFAQPCTSCAVTGGDIGHWVAGMMSGVTLGTVTTTAKLPACNAALAGASAGVSDATTPTFNATLVGGGASPVYCNGTGWVTN